MRKKSSGLHDTTLCVHHETERAWLVSETGERDKAVWLPKSEIEAYHETQRTTEGRRTMDFAIPQWLAEEKGLV